MRRSWRNTALILFLAAALVGGLWGDELLALSSEGRQALRRYTELLEVAHDSYGGEVLYRELVYSSIQGMLNRLDPHTNFLTPETYDRMLQRQQSSFFGLGILVGIRNSRLTVIAPLEGTPASRMGIRAGDVIQTIDGELTGQMTLDDAVTRLKGPKDTEVTISIVRQGVSTPLEMTIIRAEIPLITVRFVTMLTEDTGYFRITDFSRATSREVEDAIAELREQGMKRLLLDLRNNGGGLLDQAVEVGDQFVPEGETIVETRGRTRSSQQKYVAEGRFSELGLPLVVLVNSGSASASEIVAGAIQDHDIGIVVGTPTWGKGLVQTVFSLSYNTALALTTAKYYTPSGRLIQRDYTSYYDYYLRDDFSDDDEILAGPSPEDREVFLTDLGREVFGGGGITPDEIVEPQETPEFLQFLAARNAFFNFGVEYSSHHDVDSEEWAPGDDVIDEFVAWLEEQEIGTQEEIKEAFSQESCRNQATLRIRAEIFNSVFGNDAWYRVLAENDNQIQEAMRHFDRASSLLAERKRLEEPALVAELVH